MQFCEKLRRAEIVDEQPAFEMFHLMLHDGSEQADGVWARVASLDAGDQRQDTEARERQIQIEIADRVDEPGVETDLFLRLAQRRGEVIEGWDQILQLMKAGEKRLVIIPPEMAYGTRGRPPDIPRSATLVFEIELLEIKPD